MEWRGGEFQESGKCDEHCEDGQQEQDQDSNKLDLERRPMARVVNSRS
jgi:hypothetical protein